ncbi:MAG: osmotically inducible protein C, partial [Gammaproteobacteria bacterium]
FIEDLRQYDMQQRLALLDKPVLIVKVLHDELVDGDNADAIKAWTKGPAHIITLDKADHLLSNKDDAAFVANEIVAWFNNLA